MNTNDCDILFRYNIPNEYSWVYFGAQDTSVGFSVCKDGIECYLTYGLVTFIDLMFKSVVDRPYGEIVIDNDNASFKYEPTDTGGRITVSELLGEELRTISIDLLLSPAEWVSTVHESLIEHAKILAENTV